MASGMTLDGKCTKSYSQLGLAKNANALKYIIFKPMEFKDELNETMITKIGVDSEVLATAVGNNKEAYEKFVEQFPADKCQWGTFAFFEDAEEKNAESALNKIIFISWAPDICTIKEKMTHATSTRALLGGLGAVGLPHFHGTDYDEISYEKVLEKFRPKNRVR